MRTTRSSFLIPLLAGLCWFSANVVANELFSAEVEVADEGIETRNAALSRMLGDVLTRVSGNPAVGGRPRVDEILQAAPSLVQQYRYRSVPAAGREPMRYLWARFEQATLERMMRERGLPVWGQRPRVLMWVATDQAGQRSMLNFDASPEARGVALQRARARGMPLQLPLMDLEDQAALTPADIWSDYRAAVERASARYPHDLVLTGRLAARDGALWSGVWTLAGAGIDQRFETPPQSLADAMGFAIDQTQARLAARFAPAVAPSAVRGTRVRFSAIHDLEAYGLLVALFDTLEPVEGVALRHVADDLFLFEFALRGDDRELLRALDGEPQLIAEPGPVKAAPTVPAAGTAADARPAAPAVDHRYRLLY